MLTKKVERGLVEVEMIVDIPDGLSCSKCVSLLSQLSWEENKSQDLLLSLFLLSRTRDNKHIFRAITAG